MVKEERYLLEFSWGHSLWLDLHCVENCWGAVILQPLQNMFSNIIQDRVLTCNYSWDCSDNYQKQCVNANTLLVGSQGFCNMHKYKLNSIIYDCCQNLNRFLLN